MNAPFDLLYVHWSLLFILASFFPSFAVNDHEYFCNTTPCSRTPLEFLVYKSSFHCYVHTIITTIPPIWHLPPRDQRSTFNVQPSSIISLFFYIFNLQHSCIDNCLYLNSNIYNSYMTRFKYLFFFCLLLFFWFFFWHSISCQTTTWTWMYSDHISSFKKFVLNIG